MILINEDLQPGNSYTDCEDKFLPRNLKEVSFYSNINTLIHSYDEQWTDDEMREYFNDGSTYDKYFISDLEDKDKLYTKDFYESYPSSIEDIWYEAALLNNKNIFKNGINYWKFMLEPYLGTNLIQKKVLEKIDVRTLINNIPTGEHGEVIEWWNIGNEEIQETNHEINSYLLRMKKYPGLEKLEFLIQASLKIKNIESKLTSVTDWVCPGELRLCIGELNRKRLNGIFINYYFDIGICFDKELQYVFDNHLYPDPSIDGLTEHFYMSRNISHNYMIGIAMGELEGVPAEDVPSIDIVTAKFNTPTIALYEAFMTGLITEHDELRVSHHKGYIETMPGVALEYKTWDDEIWDSRTWETITETYLSVIRDTVDDQSYELLPGKPLNYTGFGFDNNQIAPSIYSIYFMYERSHV